MWGQLSASNNLSNRTMDKNTQRNQMSGEVTTRKTSQGLQGF